MKLRLLFLLLFIANFTISQNLSSLYAEYSFDNGTLINSLGTGNLTKTGTNSTLLTDRNGIANNAIALNGDNISGAANNPNAANLSFSMSFWFNTTVNNLDRTIWRNYDNFGKEVNIKMTSSGKIVNEVSVGFGQFSSKQIDTPNFILDGNWHHIVVTLEKYIDAGAGRLRVKMYIDGTEEPGLYMDGINYSYIWQAGHLIKITNYSDGIDDVKFYLSTLTASDVSTLYSAQTCVPTDVTLIENTDITLDLDWQADASVTEWELAYSEVGQNFNNLPNATGINTTKYKIEGLQPNTSYNIFLRGICGGVPSVWRRAIFSTEQKAIKVNLNATGSGNGSTWTNAYTNLKSAIDNNPGRDFWVASGVYVSGNSGRNNVFALENNQSIYGGFNGTETTLNDRLPSTPKTILSADINGNDDNSTLSFSNATRSENNHRVIVVNGDNIILDGITISGGNADSSTNSGAAIWINKANQNLTINNCEIKNNSCSGGGIIRAIDTNNGTNLTVTNTSFSYNFARFAGLYYLRPNNGRTLNFVGTNNLYFKNKIMDFQTTAGQNTLAWFRNDNNNAAKINAQFINSTFTENSLEATGSSFDSPILSVGRRNILPNIKIYNCIFWGNTNNTGATTVSVGRFDGTSYSHPVDIKNSIDEDGFSKYVGGAQQTLTSDPLFFDSVTDNYQLKATSPAIDFGGNSFLPSNLTQDFNKRERIFNGTVDLGPFEYNASTLPVQRTLTKLSDNGSLITNPNPVNGSYEDGTVVTINANAFQGFEFNSWSGDITSTNASESIVMNSNKSITANYTAKPVLNITSTNGSFTASPFSADGTYKKGTVVTITATPNTNYIFSNWDGDANGNTNPLIVTMEADKNITANFLNALRFYVDADATGNNDGTSWINAYNTLATALAANVTAADFWIAEGTYTPGSSRTDSFTIRDNQSLYGGFDGTETMLSESNPITKETVLSGDINGNDNATFSVSDANRAENSFRLINVNGTAIIIDGFTISSANANGPSTSEKEGSGISINTTASLKVNNCIFTKHTLSRAGIIRSIDILGNINISLNNSSFVDNESVFATCYYGRSGGGSLHLKVEGSLITNNKATTANDGSLFWFRQDVAGSQTGEFVNATFANNTISSSTTLITYYLGMPTINIYNSIFWNNTNGNGTIVNAMQTGASGAISNSISNNGFTGNGNASNNFTSDPLFKNTAIRDYTLQSNSPAIDSGDNSFVTAFKDLQGVTRVLNTTVDIGAFEFDASAIINRTLALTATNGSVTTNPNPTNGVYVDGTVVILTATPNTGYQFDGWSGDATGNTNPLSVTMDADKSVTALFSLMQRTLTTTSTNGTITADIQPINGTYDNGIAVELTATPNTGYQFDGWSGDVTGNTNPLSVTMDADKSVTAMFSSIQQTLSLTAVNGSITADAQPINGTYDNGTVVTLTATPNANYTFAGWSGDTTEITNPLSVTMDADKSITAIFSINQLLVTTTAVNGTITANIQPTNGTYDFGTIVEFTATPAAGYQFDGWSGDVTGNMNPLSVTMDADKSITAMFSLIQRTLTTTASNGTITADVQPTNGTYNNGTVVSLTATPDTNYQFDGWSGDATGNANPLSVTLDANKGVTAMFSLIQRTLTITAVNGTVTASPSPTNGTYANGTVVTLTATADTGFGFVEWTGDATATTNIITVTMDADKAVVANFSSTASADDFDKLDFRIYPNPASSTLNVESSFTINNATIFNVIGQKVLESTLNIIDINDLKSGIYLIKIKSEGGSVAVKRFVKK